MKQRLLLVDDDILALSATHMMLASDYLIDTASNGKEGLEKVRVFGKEYSLVLLDYRLGDQTGEAVAKDMLELQPDLFVLIYSGDTSRDALKGTWNAGAIGFLEKGIEPSELRATIANWCAKHRETRKLVSLSSTINENSEKISSLKMIGRSSKMAEIAEKVIRYRPLKDHVLILGETGTGKERIAHALHGQNTHNFYPVNCAAYSASTDLMEGELFGYEKGAFTGATREHMGVFEAAKGGTVFLDEVHALNKNAQQKLLRVLQEKKIRRVGGTKEIPVSFRLLAAAKPEIEELVEKGEFLPDLYERLNVLCVEIPPLRERPEDIEPLVAYFTAQYEKDTGEKKAVLYKTLKYLERYSWPRNVRELENTIRRICVNTTATKIEPEDLDPKFFQETTEVKPLVDEKNALLKEQIEQALLATPSQREAARRLGLPESTLRRHIKKLQVQPRASL